MSKINCAYIRLSEEDDKNIYSESILNQIALIEEYAKKEQIEIHKKYIDDGFSGINFSRPAFEEMLKEMEKGNIETIVTKDFSRLGREYIETTYYITRYFPKHNIRYIAINENYDSNKNKNDVDEVMIGIKGIMNDRYIKETSKKIQEVKKQKTQQKQDTQQKQEQMSKDNAEQLLNAAMQAEKETKKRMQNESHHSRSRKLEKNW